MFSLAQSAKRVSERIYGDVSVNILKDIERHGIGGGSLTATSQAQQQAQATGSDGRLLKAQLPRCSMDVGRRFAQWIRLWGDGIGDLTVSFRVTNDVQAFKVGFFLKGWHQEVLSWRNTSVSVLALPPPTVPTAQATVTVSAAAVTHTVTSPVVPETKAVKLQMPQVRG